ncbi:MAG: type VI secretion system-associated protein TagF [Xylophilus ampelinus]
MSAPSPVALAYFGKLASRGDFVRSAGHDALTRLLDLWVSRALERVAGDPRWKQRYDRVGACRFAFLGVRSPVALAGHLVPSADASGRRFPFVVAGSFDVAAPLEFVARAPLALGGLWPRLEAATREACGAADAAAPLARAAQAGLEVDTGAASHAADFDGFLAEQTVGGLEGALRAAHPGLRLRETVMAVGLLLQPVPGSGASTLARGIALPLPDDPLAAPLVGAFWTSLVAPFLAGGDFELALFVLRPRPGAGSCLRIGFAGGDPQALQAVFDHDADAAFVDASEAGWVDAHLEDDHAMRKLATYLAQPRLSLRQAMSTFKECFLGE